MILRCLTGRTRKLKNASPGSDFWIWTDGSPYKYKFYQSYFFCQVPRRRKKERI